MVLVPPSLDEGLRAGPRQASGGQHQWIGARRPALVERAATPRPGHDNVPEQVVVMIVGGGLFARSDGAPVGVFWAGRPRLPLLSLDRVVGRPWLCPHPVFVNGKISVVIRRPLSQVRRQHGGRGRLSWTHPRPGAHHDYRETPRGPPTTSVATCHPRAAFPARGIVGPWRPSPPFYLVLPLRDPSVSPSARLG